MNTRRAGFSSIRLQSLALLVPAGLCLVCGCSNPFAPSALELTCYKDPYFPEKYEVRFSQAAYRTDSTGDSHLVARTTRDADDGAGPVTQLLHARMFWHPKPGKTFDNPTTVDAMFEYAVITDRGAALYRGTGFIFPTRRKLDNAIVARIESARLRLVSTTGEPPESLGETRARGSIVAQDRPALAVDLARELTIQADNGPLQEISSR